MSGFSEPKLIDSSMIYSVSYNEAGQLFRVVFSNRQEYEYRDFPKGKYEEFLEAPSQGKFFHSEIKNKFEFTKL